MASKILFKDLKDIFPSVLIADYHDYICSNFYCSHRNKDGQLIMYDHEIFQYLNSFSLDSGKLQKKYNLKPIKSLKGTTCVKKLSVPNPKFLQD